MKSRLYKVLSIILSITLLLSVCSVSGAINVFATEKVTDYYVGYGGTGDGSSLENKAPTVAAAVATINANGLKAGDTANIWIVQDIDVIKNVGMKSSSRALHNAAAWVSETGSIPAHTAKIVVQPHADNQKNNPSLTTTYLLGDETVASQAMFVMGGPTEFRNIELVWNSSSNNYQGSSTGGTHIASNGHDMIIGEGVTYSRMGHNGNNVSGWVSGITEVMGNLATSVTSVSNTYTKPINMGFYNYQVLHSNRIDVPGYDRQGAITAVFAEDVTLEFNNADMGTYVRIGGTIAGNVSATFKKNLNFRVMDTYNVRLQNGANKVTVNGGVQVIMGKGSIPADYAPSKLTTVVKADGTTTADMWVLTTTKANAKYIDFIDGVTGKFQVPSNCEAVATDANGTEYTTDINGVLDLAGLPGEYTVDITVHREKVYDYYVKYGGTGDGSSVDAPAGDIATAIATVNECRLNETETATIHIMQDITAFENNTTDDNNYYHNLVSWGSTVEHDAKVVIKAYEGNTYNETVTNTYVATSKRVGDSTELCMGGPVEFQNVAILFPYGSNINKFNPIIANGNDVTFTKDSTFRYLSGMNGNTDSTWDKTIPAYDNYYGMGVGFGAAGATYTDAFRVTYGMTTNGTTAQAVTFPHGDADDNSVYTFKNDVTFENNGSVGLKAQFGTNNATAIAIFEKNINIKETAGTNLRYIAGSNIVVKGGVQVISSSAVGYNANDKFDDAIAVAYKDEAYTTAADLWKLNVGSEYIEYIDFIEGETGKFKVAGNCAVKAVNAADETLVYNVGEGEGVLDLSGLPGTYNLEFTVFKDKVYEYYVKAGGTGDGSSVDAPAPDIATAIKAINVRRLVKGEVATIYVMQDITSITATSATNHNVASWGDTVAHEATVVIKPYADNTYGGTVTKTILSTSASLGTNKGITLGGPTEFGDICILFPYGSAITSRVALNFNNESGKLSSDTTFAYFDGINSASYDSWAQASIPADLAAVMTSATMLPVYTTAGEGGNTFTEASRIEINVPYSTTTDSMAITVIGDTADTFKEDMTVVLGLAGSYNPRIRLGLNAGGAVFEKNLNVKFVAGEKAGFSSSQPFTVKGGVQYILAEGVTFHANNPYNNIANNIFKEDGVTPADLWLLKVADSQIDTVDFVEGETGKFKAELKGRIAIATKVVADGEATSDPIVAVDGVLDLSGAPGEYEISYVSEFSADGSTIRVYKDMELDLANQKHNEFLGKLFIGWKYRDKDEYPQAVNGVASIKAGSVLEAQYIDKADTDFQLEDIQLRADGNENDPAIRYIINKNKAFEEQLNVTDYGAIYMPADQAQGFEIFLDKSPVVSWYAYANESGGNEEWAVRETTGYKPTQAIADPEKVLEETETDLKYTICLTDIPEANYTTFYAVRGYIKFNDRNNIASATYTEQEISSLYKEACDTADTPEEERTDVHTDIITKSEAQKDAELEELKNGWVTPAEYGATVSVAGTDITDEEALAGNYMIYRTTDYGVRYIRTITVDTGMDVEDTELAFITDTHVTYSNEKDISLGYYNAMQYYKNRAYYGSSFNSRKNYAKMSIDSANLASLFDKVVLGGDMADYVSYGNFESTKRIWSDRSITSGKSLKGTISMTPGNHEFSQSQATATEKLTSAQLHEWHNQYMTSNSYIDYDIVYKADGTPNYMTITLDNSMVTYFDEQIEPLTQYLAYARENNIPVLLFQHVPNATGNEADSEYWYTAPEYLKYAIGGRTPCEAVNKQWLKWKSENPNATEKQKAAYADTLYAAGTNDYGEAYPRGWQYTNMYNGDGHTGWDAYDEAKADTATTKVYRLITSNYDIIKAVFCGHNHSNYDSGIVATDAEGNKLTDATTGEYITIPQYTVPAGYQNYATIINVK